MTQYALDLTAGRAARDEAMERVESATLTDQLERFLSNRRGLLLTGEDIRMQSGLGAHHPNAWGASINHLVRRGVLEQTGARRQMLVVTSHARSTPVYRVT